MFGKTKIKVRYAFNLKLYNTNLVKYGKFVVLKALKPFNLLALLGPQAPEAGIGFSVGI